MSIVLKQPAAWVSDEDGFYIPAWDTRSLGWPVLCVHCRKVYDLCGVEVIHRYADCDMFKTPCCDRTADTREWKSLPDIQKLPRGPRVTEWDEA